MTHSKQGKHISSDTEIIFCGHPIFDFEKCPLQKRKECVNCKFVIDEN